MRQSLEDLTTATRCCIHVFNKRTETSACAEFAQTHRRWPAPTEPHYTVLAELHWLPIQYRIQYKLALTAFKALTTLQPQYLHELIRPYEPGRRLRSCGKNLLHDDRTNVNFAKRAFSHAVPTVWNSLPQTVISDLSVSVQCFKSRLKTELYSGAFCN